MKFADLHLHTVFSDGTSTPQELLAESARAGLSAIAITDHDTVAGIPPAAAIAEKERIELLPGIELSVEYKGIEIHLLGYLIDYKSPALLEKLKTLKTNRIERIYKITDKLKNMGVALKPEAVFAVAGTGTVSRLHVARAMVKEKLVNSIAGAFKIYIGDKCPAYVLGFRLSPQEAIKIIRDAGGIAVLAHPYIINDDALIPEFIAFGLQGLEVYYPEHTQGMVKHYLEIAKKHNLLVTGGSDYHGEPKPNVRIGSVKISYALVEKLKQAKF